MYARTEEDVDLFDLAACQHGVVSRWQAQLYGVSDLTLNRLAERGRLERISREVLRVRGAPATWHQRVAVATLTIPNAMASHRTAAALWALDGFPPGPIEIVVERWSRRRRSNFQVRETKDLASTDVTECAGIQCTSVVRTLVDLPAVAPPFRCGQALDHACRIDRSVLGQVAARHREVARRGRNGTVAFRELLEARGAGQELVGSGFERLLLDLILDAGLPRPRTQWKVRDGDFVAYLDLAWPDRLIGLECDSLAHHFGERAHQWDRTRRRALTLLGWTMLEFTYQDVTKCPEQVERELRRALT